MCNCVYLKDEIFVCNPTSQTLKPRDVHTPSSRSLKYQVMFEFDEIRYFLMGKVSNKMNNQLDARKEKRKKF